MMRAIRRHYDGVKRELAPDPGGMVLPSRIHAVVLVSTVHKPTLRALAFARAGRPDTLTAVTVNVDGGDTRELQRLWEEHDIALPLGSSLRVPTYDFPARQASPYLDRGRVAGRERVSSGG